MIRHPLPSTGSPWSGFPCFDGTMGCSESLPSIPPRFVAFAWRYHDGDAVLRVRPRGRSRRWASRQRRAWGFLRRFPLSGPGRGDDGDSQVPGEPRCGRALLFDPGGTGGPGHSQPADAAFRSLQRRRLPRFALFRGSITRPTHSLSTLRSRDRSRTTQDSLPAAGLLCRVGLATHWVPMQGQLFMLHLLTQALPGALQSSARSVRNRAQTRALSVQNPAQSRHLPVQNTVMQAHSSV
jgi:hypothetical protein